MTATPEKPELSPDEIAAELQASGIVLTKQDLQNMIAPRRAEASANAEARAVDLFPLKPMLPLHVSYEVGRRACASRELCATKIGGDWFVTKADVAAWLTSSGKWFESASAVQKWHAALAQLKQWWIP